MSDLREAVVALPSGYYTTMVSRAAVLALIDAHECVPDVERLAAALRAWDGYWTETSAPKAAASIATIYAALWLDER